MKSKKGLALRTFTPFSVNGGLALRSKATKGFSLIELLIVIAVLGVLMVAGVGNYFSSVGRSRDAKRKADLSTIQKGLESYYNDHGVFPDDITSDSLCESDVNCYVVEVPVDPNGSQYYYVLGDVNGTAQSFQLYSTLERRDDNGIGTNQTTDGFSSNCNTICRYGVASSNTTPDATP